MSPETPAGIRTIILSIRNNKHLKNTDTFAKLFNDKLSEQENERILSLIASFQSEVVDLLVNGGILVSIDGKILNIDIDDLINEGSTMRINNANSRIANLIKLVPTNPTTITIYDAALQSLILSKLFSKYSDNKQRRANIYIVDKLSKYNDLPRNFTLVLIAKFEKFMGENGYSILNNKGQSIVVQL